jgi:hypothetical protein
MSIFAKRQLPGRFFREFFTRFFRSGGRHHSAPGRKNASGEWQALVKQLTGTAVFAVPVLVGLFFL